MSQGKVTVTDKLNEHSLVLPDPPNYEEATRGGSPNYSGVYPGDGESLTEFRWDDQNIRRNFIRKVFAILAFQLSITLAIVSLFTFCDPIKDYIHSNPGWYWAAYVVFLVTYLTLLIFKRPRRQFPWNMILLAVFTLALSYMTGMLSSYYNTMSVIICLVITVLVCLAITIFSFQTKIDMTSYQGVLLTFCTSLCVCAVVLSFLIHFLYVPWLQTLFAGLAAILFCLFLAFDTQMLMGKRYSLCPEDYVFATLSIYLDIVYIFSFFLQLFGCEQN
ncbi:protein lifeguard 2-like [Hoplias malabaricus]|uniref:protein lifeguard 2-like n=1 Tax=Hoplias malabaricus TaxID=27720 RepID=UPI0034626B3A